MAQTTENNRSAGFNKVAVIGFGLIGASFAAALREARPEAQLLAVDTDVATRSEAVSRGWATATAAPDASEFRAFIEDGCDLVVLATPVSVVESYLRDLAAWDYRGIITDTASTKSRIIGMAAEALPHPHNYVPGHPMAGSEKNGIKGARADLFKGAYWILCPDADTPAEHFARLHELVTSIGARVISLPREQHDAAVAVVSHVPHFMASSLVQLAVRHAKGQDALMRLAAGGFKDSTRIAAGSPELWCGIAMDNSEAIADGMRELRGILQQFEDAIRGHDEETLTKLLAESTELRRNLPTKWIPESAKLTCVRIPMSNRSGVIAEVTGFAGHAACNIQSIDIDHINEDTAVLELILTDEGDMGKLGAELINGGYDFSFRALSE